jgi:uncharacterized protein (DUF2225 family)
LGFLIFTKSAKGQKQPKRKDIRFIFCCFLVLRTKQARKSKTKKGATRVVSEDPYIFISFLRIPPYFYLVLWIYCVFAALRADKELNKICITYYF